MGAQSDDRTSFQRAGITHFDFETPPKLVGSHPIWVSSRRQLWLGSRLIKEFARLAPRQSAILEAFEVLGWPETIDNPFHHVQVGELAIAKKLLRQTIDNLNSGLPTGTIRFHGDGSGFGIRWELCSNNGFATDCCRDQPAG